MTEQKLRNIHYNLGKVCSTTKLSNGLTNKEILDVLDDTLRECLEKKPSEWYKPAIFICFICGAVLFVNWLLTRYRWYTLLARSFVVCFLLSIGWNYYAEYERVLIEDYKSMKLPDGCLENTGYSLLGAISAVFDTLFFIRRADHEDACYKYIRSKLTSPVSKVAPMDAVMITVSNLVLTPAKLVGKATNNVFRSLFEGVPVMMIPVLVVMTLYVFTLFVVTVNGYTVSVPLLLDIKPGQESTRGLVTNVVKAIYPKVTKTNVIRRKRIKLY